MKSNSPFTMLTAAMALLCLPAMTVSAAMVDFFPSTEFVDSDNIDVSLGHVIYAINAGDTGDDQTVIADGENILFENIVDTVNAIQSSGSVFSGTPGQLYSVATDQVSLDEVLNSHGFDDGAPMDVTLLNLVVGQAYRIQVIGPADDRGCCSGRFHTVGSADGGIVGDINRFEDFDGDGDAHVLTTFGTFIADSTSQVLNFAGANNGGYSAIIVTSNVPPIPEPTTCVLGLLAGIGCVTIRRRSSK